MTPYERGFMDKCAELGVDPAALVKQSAVRPARLILGKAWKSLPRDARKKLGAELASKLRDAGWLRVNGPGLIPRVQRETTLTFGDHILPGHDRFRSLFDRYIHGTVVARSPELRAGGGWDSVLPPERVMRSTAFPLSLEVK